MKRSGSALEIVRYKTKVENKTVFEFLFDLNRDLDEVRGRILGR